MTDIAHDIHVLANVIVAFQEGASDEKRAAMNMLERLLSQKQAILEQFEMQAETV